MSIDIVRKDYAKYTDPNGLVSGERHPKVGSGNAILFTAQAAFVLEAHGEDGTRLAELERAVVRECQLEPGLFRRGSNWTDQEGPDDYVGITFLSSLLDRKVAREVVAYGRAHRYRGLPLLPAFYFRNEEPRDVRDDVRAWLGRQPALLAHFEIAAGGKPNCFLRAAWAFAVGTSGAWTGQGAGHHDGWILSRLLVETYRRAGWRSAVMDKACQVFFERLEKKAGGMRAVFAAYFNDAEHPTSLYWPGP